MAVKPNLFILAKVCGDNEELLDWKNHIYRTEKAAKQRAGLMSGKWKIFKLEPVEVSNVGRTIIN